MKVVGERKGYRFLRGFSLRILGTILMMLLKKEKEKKAYKYN